MLLNDFIKLFQIRKSLKKEGMRHALQNVLHDIVYSEYMDDYVDYLAEIVCLVFEKYFLTTGIVVHIAMWVSFKRDSSIHFGNTTNSRLECSHNKLKELFSQTSSLSEVFEGVLTFMKFVDQESSHHAFVEQFTSVCTKLDHACTRNERCYHHMHGICLQTSTASSRSGSEDRL